MSFAGKVTCLIGTSIGTGVATICALDYLFCLKVDICEKQVETDEETCRPIKDRDVRRRCWASANTRFGACGNGDPLPPLVTW